MDHTNPAYHIPWVWSDESDCHITNDHKWFSDFIEYPSHVNVTSSDGRSTKVEVHGIGSVELNVKSSAEKNRSKRITLYNVLYVPILATNIVGYPILDDYIVDESDNKLIDFMDGAEKGLLFQHGDYRKLRLKYNHSIRANDKTEDLFVPTATWSKEEKTKLKEAYKIVRNAGNSREVALRMAPRKAFARNAAMLAGVTDIAQGGGAANTRMSGADRKESALLEQGKTETLNDAVGFGRERSGHQENGEARRTVLGGWEAFAVNHGGNGRGD